MLIYHRAIHSHSRVGNAMRGAFSPQYRAVHTYTHLGSTRAGLYRIANNIKSLQGLQPGHSSAFHLLKAIPFKALSRHLGRNPFQQPRAGVMLVRNALASKLLFNNLSRCYSSTRTLALRAEGRTPITDRPVVAINPKRPRDTQAASPLIRSGPYQTTIIPHISPTDLKSDNDKVTIAPSTHRPHLPPTVLGLIKSARHTLAPPTQSRTTISSQLTWTVAPSSSRSK